MGVWRRTSVRVLGVSVLLAVVAGLLTFFIARPASTDTTLVGEGTSAATSAATQDDAAPTTPPAAAPPATTAPALSDTPLFVIPAGGSTIRAFSGRRPADIEFTRHVPDFVVDIRWTSWGLKEATGHGKVLNEQPQFDPNQDEQPAVVVFSNPMDGKFTRAIVSVPTRENAVYTYGSGNWPLKAEPEAKPKAEAG